MQPQVNFNLPQEILDKFRAYELSIRDITKKALDESSDIDIKKPITDFNLLENFQDSLSLLGRTDIEITSKNKTYAGYINGIEITEDSTSPVVEIKLEFTI